MPSHCLNKNYLSSNLKYLFIFETPVIDEVRWWRLINEYRLGNGCYRKH
jgi:hypothetical protein